MRVDRSLVGTVLIALLVSTLVTLFIVGEKGAPYLVVKNEYRGAEKGRFVVGQTILAKEPIGCLKLSYFCLVNKTDLIGNISREGSPQEVCARIPSLRSYLDMTDAGLRAPEIGHFKMQLPLWVDGDRLVRKTYDVYLYDFSRTVWQAVPSELMHSLTRPAVGTGHLWDFYDAFACLFDEKGNLSYFYQGVADFYLRKVISIEELTIQKDEEKSRYYGAMQEARPGEGGLSILDAPERGVVSFEDLRRNDRVTNLFSLDSSKLPRIHQMIHIVAITVDELQVEYMASVAEPPKPTPRA